MRRGRVRAPIWWLHTALGAAAVALAGGHYAADLFLPVGPGVAAAARTGPAGRSAATVPDAWERRVRVARHELAAARANVESAGAGRLLLNVRDGVRLDVVIERTAPTRYGYSLSGRIVGGAAQVGFVTLVVHDDAVAGSVWTPDSAYELNYLGGGVHALRDVTNAPPIECGGAVPAELSQADAATSAEGSPDDASVVDILVIWTPAAEDQAGGEVQMLSLIDQRVASTNDSFERSGVFVSLNLVGAERVDYVELDPYTDFGRLVDPSDGHMDEVHRRRDALGADLVHLRSVGNLGLGSIGGAFSMNSLAHEVGHNFGIWHERHEFRGASGPRGFRHGFTTAARCANTIMSYGGECAAGSRRVPLYASPWRHSPRDGDALGATRFSKDRGARGPADAVLTLNRNRHRFANLRPSRNGG